VQLGVALAIEMAKLHANTVQPITRGVSDAIEAASRRTTRARAEGTFATLREQFTAARVTIDASFAAAAAAAAASGGGGVGRGGSVGLYRQSGLKAVNFTQGEVHFVDFCRMLQIAYDSARPPATSAASGQGRVFVDLGCAAGACVAAALLTSQHLQSVPANSWKAFTHVVGVDLMRSKIAECGSLLSLLTQHAPTGPRGSAIEGNFLRYEADEDGQPAVFDWTSGDVDVVFGCATCFADDVMRPLIAGFAKLKKGARIIMIDKQLPTAPTDPFALVGSCQVRSSWGEGFAYIYITR
jgi:hypothetical protein